MKSERRRHGKLGMARAHPRTNVSDFDGKQPLGGRISVRLSDPFLTPEQGPWLPTVGSPGTEGSWCAAFEQGRIGADGGCRFAQRGAFYLQWLDDGKLLLCV